MASVSYSKTEACYDTRQDHVEDVVLSLQDKNGRGQLPLYLHYVGMRAAHGSVVIGI